MKEYKEGKNLVKKTDLYLIDVVDRVVKHPLYATFINSATHCYCGIQELNNDLYGYVISFKKCKDIWGQIYYKYEVKK